MAKLDIPSRRNVDLGDLVAFPNKVGLIKLFPVIRRGSNYIVVKDSSSERLIRYDHAIVIKKDKTVLVGESTYNPKLSKD